MKSSLFGMGIVLAGLMGLEAGCSITTLNVMNYPTFFGNEEDYHSMAVAPVQNSVQPGRFTRELSAGLVSKMYNNGYYDVADYTHEDVSDNQLIAHLSNNTDTELVTFSTVVDYGERWDEHTETRTETRTYYEEDEEGNEIEYTEEYKVKYPVYERTTYADTSVIVVDVQSGNRVYNSVRNGTCYEEAEDPHDMSSPMSALWCAFDRSLSSEVYQISPTYDSVRIDPEEVMKVYRVESESKWERTTDFGPNDMMAISFWFPSAAIYNYFKFDIVYGDDDKVIASEKMYWNGGNRKVFQFDLAAFVENTGGVKKYTIRLWNGKRVAFTRKIKVK